MKRVALLLIAVFCLGLAAGAIADEPSAFDIAKRSLERDEGKDKVESVRMVIVTSSGKTKERTFVLKKLYDPSGNMQLIRFSEPAKYKNYGFLALQHKGKDDDRWMFMARQKKTVRIEAGNQNDAFMQSDMNYYDMSDHEAEDQTHELKGMAVVDGFECWIISSVPKDKDVEYSRIESWIRKDNFVAVRMKIYDEKDRLLKEGTVRKLEQVDGFWVVMELHLANVQKGTSTTLIMEEVKHNTGQDASEFTLQKLENP